jgi:hypothetical protein
VEACAGLAAGFTWWNPGPGGAADHETAVANSLSRADLVTTAVDGFRWEQLAPLRDAEERADEQGRAAASTLRTLREAVEADEFATRLGPALVAADDAIFAWLTPSKKPLPTVGGRPTMGKGAPNREVLDQVTAFLEAHRDEEVVVQWRVQE